MKKVITSLVIILLVTLMVPTFAQGASFYCSCGDERCGKSIGGIFHAMKRWRGSWLNTRAQVGSGWGNEQSPSEARETDATIRSVGALCFGHRTSSNGRTSAVVGAVIDTSATKGSYKEHLLAYWVRKSFHDGETASNSDGKARIRKWAHEHYGDYNGVIQNVATNTGELEDVVKDYETTAAKKYANSVANSKFSSSTGTNGPQRIQYINGVTYIGPYNLNFSGGSMKNAILTKNDNSTKTITKYSTTTDGRTTANLTSLTSFNGDNFYLVYNGEIDSVSSITLKKEIKAIKSRTVLTHAQQRGGQNVAIFYGEYGDPKEITVTLKGVPYASIEITKVDKETREKLTDIGFVLKCEGQGYVAEDSSGKIIYVAKIEDAKVYKTKTSGTGKGTIKIEKLSKGGTYTIYEVKNKYEIYEPVSKSSPKEVGKINNLTLGSNEKYTAENRRYIADLTITKKDVDTGVNLAGIQFILYCKGQGYVKKGNPVTFVKNKSEATKFTTKDDGTVTIKNLLRDKTYKIYEVGYTDAKKSEYYIYGEVSLDKPKDLGSVKIDVTDKQNYVKTYTATNDQIVAHIDITKKDSKDSSKKLPNIGFVAYLPGKGYVKDNGKALSTYVGTIDEATVYYTKADGTVRIKDLPVQGTYTIYEVDNEDYYEYLEIPKDKPMEIGKVTVNDFTTFEITLKNDPVDLAKLEITKIDEDSTQSMEGVGFVIYREDTKEYLQDAVPVKYTKDIKQATIYRTGKDGKAIVGNIRYERQYTIYEVENKNFGYEEVSLDKPKKLSTVTVNRHKDEKTGTYVTETFVTETNKRLYIKLSGYVWEDIVGSKGSTRDDVWNENDTDERVNNVKVTLKKADGKVLDTRETAEEGTYKFGDYFENPKVIKIKIEDLEGAYIEFEYNGMCYKSVPVKLEQDNGSKAKDDNSRDEFNNAYSTIEKGKAKTGNYNLKYDYKDNVSTLNYGGQYRYGYEGQNYPISGIDSQYLLIANTKDAKLKEVFGTSKNDIYKNEIEEIKNINLGIYEREMPDIAVMQDIENAIVTLNGYEHTYKYADRFKEYDKEGLKEEEKGFNATVKFQNKFEEASYTREIHSSDVKYNKTNPGKMEMYITYKTALRNQATIVDTKVNQFVNYFDAEYEIASITYGDINATPLEEGEDKDYEVDGSWSEGGYKRVYINSKQEIDGQKQDVYYIKYKLSQEALENVLNGNVTLESIVEVMSYSSFKDGEVYAGVDKDSAPDSTDIDRYKETFEDDTDKAPSLILKTYENREIKGNVWEEKAIAELLANKGHGKERKGDGQYTTNENPVGKVKVELLNEDGSLAKLYKHLIKPDGEYEKYADKEASMETNEKGEYSFDGVLPGKYKLRFTYGNESYIRDLATEQQTTINADYYKSTLFRTTSNSNGNITKDETNNNYWYRKETSKDSGALRLSDAKDIIGYDENGERDIITERTQERNAINYESVITELGVNKISAESPIMNVKIDYQGNKDYIDEDDLKSISENGHELKFVFDQMDFGIIERPKQPLIIGKEISYVEVILANGQVLVSGDPRKEEIKYLQMLPNGNVHVELDSELIQGATVKVKYEVSVDNSNCEVDYNNLEYYVYGKIPSNREAECKIATVTDMFDYPNSKLNFSKQEGENSDWEYKSISDIEEKRLSPNARTVLAKENKILHSKVFENMQPGDGKRISEVVLTRLLANGNEDFNLDNYVEVNELKERKIDHAIPGNYEPGNDSTYEPDTAGKDMSITGPTGEDRSYIPYIILGISSAIILATGIVFIKKKIIK